MARQFNVAIYRALAYLEVMNSRMTLLLLSLVAVLCSCGPAPKQNPQTTYVRHIGPVQPED